MKPGDLVLLTSFNAAYMELYLNWACHTRRLGLRHDPLDQSVLELLERALEGVAIARTRRDRVAHTCYAYDGIATVRPREPHVHVPSNTIFESKTFKKYHPEELRPGSKFQSDEELVQEGSKFTQTIFHPVGTCKMGNDENSVVNDELKVHGLQNLRVIDASIMPNITSGNTNAPTIMIAEKGADMILESNVN